jgi:epoxyqueuosine reductase
VVTITANTDSGPPGAALWDRIRSLGRSVGIAALGSCSAEPLEPARTVLPLRKAQGLSATMQFTYRNPERSTDPTRALGSAQSIVVAAWPYARTASGPVDRGEAVGRVAQYAWRDHYADLRTALETIAELLRTEGHEAQVHLDDNHLVDRNVAYRAGLGWYGKNANLLLPGLGSWFVLGSVLTDATLPTAAPPLADGCGPCRRCIDDCPTDAIVAPGVVDARRCLAWLVQGPGEIPVEFRAAVGDRIYGCDDCQDVCPPNQARIAGPPLEVDGDPAIEIAWILRAGDDELMARVGRWYIAGRDPNVVRRTALVVLGNTGDPSDPAVAELLARYRNHDLPLLREHADWAAEQLGLTVS